MKKILVLYRELAGYFVACVNYLSANHGVEVDIVAYPVHKDAPFEFQFAPGVRVYSRAEFGFIQIEELISQRDYQLIFCGGWADRDYIRLIRKHPSVPSLLGFDKQWLGSFRDFAGALYLRMLVVPHFNYAFVPGREQFSFARMMGFPASHIVQGAYTCDYELYSDCYQKRQENQRSQGRRQIWFTGRYAAEKSVEEMWRCTAELLDTELPDWELHCIGTGPLWDTRISHPRIYHHGFVQPAMVGELISHGEIGLLPSRYEPWGLAAQEYATAGFALIVSDRVGARFAFVSEGENGRVFPHSDWDAFKRILLEFCRKDPAELRKMGRVSHLLGSAVNWETWSSSVLSMMNPPNE